jgi:hypothetical protein
MRYYCPQWCHNRKGWIDLPSLASLKRKEAEDAAEQFAKENLVVVRTIRKPKGWKPDGSNS